METDVKTVVEECTHGSDEGRLSFPEVVMKLMEAGVEQYHADLVRSEKTYYVPNGESIVIPGRALPHLPARNFSAAAVEAAVRAIQAQKIGYREFCERIAAGGCTGYFVSMAGRRAVYYGRTAEAYVELFPNAP
jgi:uncharacterized protein YbcV (DUF1398 family)